MLGLIYTHKFIKKVDFFLKFSEKYLKKFNFNSNQVDFAQS
jgi:hypothetical protein